MRTGTDSYKFYGCEADSHGVEMMVASFLEITESQVLNVELDMKENLIAEKSAEAFPNPETQIYDLTLWTSCHNIIYTLQSIIMQDRRQARGVWEVAVESELVWRETSTFSWL